VQQRNRAFQYHSVFFTVLALSAVVILAGFLGNYSAVFIDNNNTHAQPGTTNHEIKGQNIVISYKKKIVIAAGSPFELK